MVVIDFFNDTDNWKGNLILEQYKTNVPISCVGCQVILYIKTAVPFIKRT